jgi:hypothetical protein
MVGLNSMLLQYAIQETVFNPLRYRRYIGRSQQHVIAICDSRKSIQSLAIQKIYESHNFPISLTVR